MKQAKELGIDVNWIASFGAENQPLITEYGDVAEGLTYPYTFDITSDISSVREFISDYKEKYNEIPDFMAANAYDAINVLALAIENTGEDPEKVKEFIPTIQNFQGGSGVLSFDKNGDVEKPIFIKQVRNGKFVKI